MQCHCGTTVDIYGPQNKRGATRFCIERSKHRSELQQRSARQVRTAWTKCEPVTNAVLPRPYCTYTASRVTF